MLILHLEYLKQELNIYAANYKADSPHPKYLLAIAATLKTLSAHLQYHQTHYSTALNLNPDIKSEATLKTLRFQKSNNHMDDTIPL